MPRNRRSETSLISIPINPTFFDSSFTCSQPVAVFDFDGGESPNVSVYTALTVACLLPLTVRQVPGHTAAPPNSMCKNRPKIVFLGSDLSAISLGCLKALAAVKRYDFLVGIDHYDKSVWQLVKMTLRRHGLRGLLSRITKLIVARATICLRPVGPDFQDGRCLREVAQLQGMETFQCSGVNKPDVRQIIKTFDPDLIVVANFSQIIGFEVRAIPKFGVINFHPSLLPKYRGPLPNFWIIKNGEKKSGASVHLIDDGIDTGDIIMQQEISLLPTETEKTLITRTLQIGAPLLVKSVESLIAGTAQREAQVESESTYFGFPNARKK